MKIMLECKTVYEENICVSLVDFLEHDMSALV